MHQKLVERLTSKTIAPKAITGVLINNPVMIKFFGLGLLGAENFGKKTEKRYISYNNKKLHNYWYIWLGDLVDKVQGSCSVLLF